MFDRKRILQIQLQTDWEDYKEDMPAEEKEELLNRIEEKESELEAIEIRERERQERLKREQERDRREMITGYVKGQL